MQFLVLFGAGIYCAQRDVVPVPIIGLAICALGIAACRVAHHHFMGLGLPTAVIGGMLALMAAAMRRGAVTQFIRNRVDRYHYLGLSLIGVVSYSLYVWHYALLNIVVGYNWQHSHRLRFDLSDFWRGAAITFAIVGFSIASYWCIERPFMRSIRSRLITAQRARRAMAHEQSAATRTPMAITDDCDRVRGAELEHGGIPDVTAESKS
jgi:peptidoglycan/LPS O-acetylase OafA/YrhL